MLKSLPGRKAKENKSPMPWPVEWVIFKIKKDQEAYKEATVKDGNFGSLNKTMLWLELRVSGNTERERLSTSGKIKFKCICTHFQNTIILLEDTNQSSRIYLNPIVRVDKKMC